MTTRFQPAALALMGALSFTLLLGTTACKDESRTDDKALVNRDDDEFPGNDNELDEPGLAEEGPQSGTIQSYGRGEDEPGSEEVYDNIFRRDADDAGNSSYTTDDDYDSPHVQRPGDDPEANPRAGLGVSADDDASAGAAPSASTIERYDPADPEPEETYMDEGDDQEAKPYGNNMAVDGPTINEEQAAARERGDTDFDEGIGGGQQTAIGAEGYANGELREYYETDEEDYIASAGSQGESWGSWYRPLDPYERGYNERTIQLGEPEGKADMSLDARYDALQRRLYDVPENQQSVVYAPNDYTFQFIGDWEGLAMSARGESETEAGDSEVAYDRPPLMGTGCEQADSPVTCSSTALDKSLQRFLNDGRVLRSMMAAGINGVSFEVDTAGQVKPASVRAIAQGRVCEDDDCRRFNRAMATALRKEEWTPGTRFGRVTDARVNLDLKYRQTEEQVDFEAEEAGR